MLFRFLPSVSYLGFETLFLIFNLCPSFWFWFLGLVSHSHFRYYSRSLPPSSSSLLFLFRLPINTIYIVYLLLYNLRVFTRLPPGGGGGQLGNGRMASEYIVE